jgi:histidine triad (HIT) family protein
LKDDCLFCKIANGDVPSYKVYEDENFLVILDRFPRNEGECLVLTKQHFDNIFDLDPALVSKAFELAQRVALKLKETLPMAGLNILQNNGAAAGQQVNHFHLHVIPRAELDSIVIQGKAMDPEPAQFEEILKKIKM